MNLLTLFRRRGSLILFVALSFLVLLLLSTPSYAQQPSPGHQSHAANPASPAAGDAALVQQLRELQSKVTRLEAALKQNHQAASSVAQPNAAAGQGMGMMGEQEMAGGMGAMQPRQDMRGMGMGRMGMGGMGMMEREGMGMGAMQTGQGMQSGGGMGMMEQEGMSMMGQMQGMGSMQMQSALPGFAGASHIYHVGATGFFLDHPQHIMLTQEQQATLNRTKQQALLEKSTYDRSIAQAEQELWVLTSSDSPDINQIEAKVREVEKLRGDKRIAFIRAVGEAAMVLTDDQRQTLAGHATHETTSADSRAQ
jgi:hypothetical protein